MPAFVADEQDIKIDVNELLRLSQHVLNARRVPDDMELSVLLVDSNTIAELNAHHMGKDGPTDVLAFPIDEPGESPPGAPSILGDVVVCPEVARDQASQFDRTFEEELRLLVVHGILHLLGMDHADADEERVMFALTDELLESFQ